MKIIIVGLGKVGRTLAEDLCEEGHDITAIDVDQERVEEFASQYDLMGIHGNGANHSTQVEAGIDTADLLISVTGSDELNLLCCLIAKRSSNCNAVARVRNPDYNTEIDFIREKLGLSTIINPELASARDIAQNMRFPSAIEVDTFARNRVEMLSFRVEEGSVLDGIRMADLSQKVEGEVLICAVERGEDLIIPDGDTVLKAKDMISLVAGINEANKFFEAVGIEVNPVKNVMIVGGSSIAFYLTRMLEAVGMHVKIIERSLERCETLSEILPKTTIVHGDATDKELLLEEGLERYDAFAALTNVDEENILISLYAKKMGGHKKKIFTKIDRIAFDEVIRELDLDTIVHPKDITAELISRYVRTQEQSAHKGSDVETLHKIIHGKAEALEFVIREETKITEKPLQNLPMRDGVLVACIYRNKKSMIPRGSDQIQVGDRVIVITQEIGLNQIDDILR